MDKQVNWQGEHQDRDELLDTSPLQRRRGFLKSVGAIAAAIPALPALPAAAQTTVITPPLAAPIYFLPVAPSSGEEIEYSRQPFLFWWYVNTFTWRWKFTSLKTGPWPTVRLLVDGKPATPYLTPPDGVYNFSLTVPNGHHIVEADVPGNVITFAKPFLVNSTGKPLAVQNPWTASNRFELTNGKMQFGKAQVSYPGQPVVPVRYALKARTFASFNGEYLPKSERWARRFHSNFTNANVRRFVELPTGDVGIEIKQKYFYSDCVAQGFNGPPKGTLRDGTLGVGTIGYCYKGIYNPSDMGVYLSDPNGRLCFLWNDGHVTTLLGWRQIAGELGGHGGVINPLYQYAKGSGKYRPEDVAQYQEKWEYVGDWSRVPDPKRFNEPWGFEGFGGHHEFWICDTLNNRILYANHYTSHPATTYAKPQLPPRGYVAPDAPTGQSQVVPFILGPSAFVREPWDCVMLNGKLYWTNFAGNSICRANLDGTNPEIVIASSIQPSDAALGFVGRLSGGPNNLSANRGAYIIDGKIGVASCVRPQGISYDSQGNLIWVERYTFAIRKLNLATRMVSTVALIGGNNRNGKADITVHVDREGTIGPVDDIFVNTWRNGDYRYAKDGTFREQWMFTGGPQLHNGPLDKCESPDYTWAFAFGHGRLIVTGSAGGSQCLEITRRSTTDPDPDTKKFTLGRAAYTNGAVPPMQLTHGPGGEGELGLPTIDEMGSWTDAKLRTYGLANGIPSASLDAWVYWVRWTTIDQDYTLPPVH